MEFYMPSMTKIRASYRVCLGFVTLCAQTAFYSSRVEAANPQLPGHKDRHVIQTVQPDRYGLPISRLDFLIDHDKPSQASQLLSTCKRVAKDDDLRHMLNAAILADTTRYEEADAELGHVKNFDEGSNVGLELGARTYMNMQNFAGAKKLSTLSIGRDGSRKSYEVRAACLMEEKRYSEAAQDYKKAAELYPHYAYTYYSKAALALLQNKQPKEALQFAILGGSTDRGETPTNNFVIGRCFAECGKMSEAIAAFSKAIGIIRANPHKDELAADPMMSHCLAERAKCYLALGQKDKAAADKRELEKLSNSVADFLIKQ